MAAARELAEQLPISAAATLVFCSSDYDLNALGAALQQHLVHPVFGCTTAGELGPGGYLKNSITAITFAAGAFEIQAAEIDLVGDIARNAVAATAMATELAEGCRGGERVFGVVLTDGLAKREEELMAQLFLHTPPFTLVGGSAGDSLRFEQTEVLYRGSFAPNRAVLLAVRTRLPFLTFRFQHHTSAGVPMVVTKADSAERIIWELNGRPAVEEYARVTGVVPEQFGPEHFSANALSIRIGGKDFLRSIQDVVAGGGIKFYCGIDQGAVLRVAEAGEAVLMIDQQVHDLRKELGDDLVSLCFDCVLRRLEFERDGVLDTIGGILEGIGAVGFSTYGEQYNGLHINQTLVGIAFRKS
ncbi:MAG: FIST N-terminal domain-containing protein [Planctomycetota bacterium]